MSRPTRVWSLYSEDTGQQYDGLTVAEARAIVMVISHEVRSFWFAYKAGWNSWRPLKDCGVLLTSGGMSRTKITYDAPDFDVAAFEAQSQGEDEIVEESAPPSEHTQTNTRTSPDNERLIPEAVQPEDEEALEEHRAKPSRPPKFKKKKEPVVEEAKPEATHIISETQISKHESTQAVPRQKTTVLLDGIEEVDIEMIEDGSVEGELAPTGNEREFTTTGADGVELSFEATKTGLASNLDQKTVNFSPKESTAVTSIRSAKESESDGIEMAPVDANEEAIVETPKGKIVTKPADEKEVVSSSMDIPIDTPINIDEEVSQVSQLGENRRTERYRIKLHAEVVVKNKVYQTFTRDVSLGGVAVQGCLPGWVVGYGMIILSTLDMRNRLEFMCSVVENQNGRNFRLELYPSPHSPKLKQWLENGAPVRKIG